MEETIMNQDEIVEETAMVPVTETEIETIADDNEVVDSSDAIYINGNLVLAIGMLIGIGTKVAYDKVGKPAIDKIKAKIAMVKATHEKKEKADDKEVNSAVATSGRYPWGVSENHETDDDIQAED